MPNNDQWKKKLTREQYRVMREKGTESLFSGKYWDSHEKGMYKCAACGAELFSSDAKFDSGTGWPSFTEPANSDNIELRNDSSHGPPSPGGFGRASMRRVEVVCKRCGSHLGHVFDDALKELGGKRYCINSVCLTLEKKHIPSNKKYWSAYITKHSNALDLEENVFTFSDPKKIALSLKSSAEQSARRKAGPYQSAMSMLNFYINRAGKNLPPKQKNILEQAKIELRKAFKRL